MTSGHVAYLYCARAVCLILPLSDLQLGRVPARVQVASNPAGLEARVQGDRRFESLIASASISRLLAQRLAGITDCWHNDFLESPIAGTTISWNHRLLAQRFPGITDCWHNDFLESPIAGASISWNHRLLVHRLAGITDCWHSGP